MSKAWDELNDIEQDDLVYAVQKNVGWEDVHNNHVTGIRCRREVGAVAHIDTDPAFAAMRAEIVVAQAAVDARKAAYGRAVAERFESDISRELAARCAPEPL